MPEHNQTLSIEMEAKARVRIRFLQRKSFVMIVEGKTGIKSENEMVILTGNATIFI